MERHWALPGFSGFTIPVQVKQSQGADDAHHWKDCYGFLEGVPNGHLWLCNSESLMEPYGLLQPGYFWVSHLRSLQFKSCKVLCYTRRNRASITIIGLSSVKDVTKPCPLRISQMPPIRRYFYLIVIIINNKDTQQQ